MVRPGASGVIALWLLVGSRAQVSTGWQGYLAATAFVAAEDVGLATTAVDVPDIRAGMAEARGYRRGYADLFLSSERDGDHR